MAIDPIIPKRFVQNFLESNPGYRPGQNEETDALFNPSIQARPLHVPKAGQIKRRINTEVEFFWAFDKCGLNPNHDRVEQLREVGFDYATTNDVEMAVTSTVQGKDDKTGFSSEIRNGDRRLMKVKKLRWLQIRKAQLLNAIMMTNASGKVMGDDGTVMGVANTMPGVRTQVMDNSGDFNINDVRASAGMKGAAVESDATEDLSQGQVRGNASRVPKEVVHGEKTMAQIRAERGKR
jgi:hypothetical protein